MSFPGRLSSLCEGQESSTWVLSGAASNEKPRWRMAAPTGRHVAPPVERLLSA